MSRLLVVDDDETSLTLIGELIGPPQRQVETARDGVEAWELLDREPEGFDLLILDRFMPRMDGMALLARLRGDPRFEDLPVIMQTSASSPHEIAEGLRAGAWYYLAKPYEDEALRRIVAGALSDRFNRLELRRLRADQSATWAMLQSARFVFRDIAQARRLASRLAELAPRPKHVAMGLLELLVNAVEHGNLEVGYAEKSRLIDSGGMEAELARRLADPALGARRATLSFERAPEQLVIEITDEGPGFDWARFLELDPERAFDSHGRGIAMARRMAFSTLEYLGKGNRVRATVSLTASAQT